VAHLRFGTKAMLDSLPTQCNLTRWGKSTDNKCCHCGRPENIVHVLNGCNPQLKTYSYRHDSILSRIADFFAARLCADVQLWVDLTDHAHAMPSRVFPACIHVTALRPDIVMADLAKRRVWLIKLTCPHEDLRDELFQLDPPFSVELLTVEVGSRGLYESTSLSLSARALHRSGAIQEPPPQSVRQLTLACSKAALAASFWIWNTHKSKDFDPTMPLL